jgi:digeranylgeranylglycerophospholipid reductase
LEKFDVIIVGAGGAGLMTARELGKLKYKVLLLDKKNDILKFPFNTLGSFLDLEKFSLSENVVAQKTESIVLHTKLHKRKLKSKLHVLDKRELHLELINSLDLNFVTLKTGIKIVSFSSDPEGNIHEIQDHSLNSYGAKIFIDCSGNDGFFTKKFNLQEQNFTLATGVEYNVEYLGKKTDLHLFLGKEYQGGYAWVFPLQNKRAIIGFGSFDDAIVKNLKKKLDSIMEMPVLKELVKKDNNKCEGGSIPITRVNTNFVYKNLIAIGDSVTQVNPIVGEGYKFIFESSHIAANAVDLSLKSNDLHFLEEYNSQWKNRFKENYSFSKYVQKKIFKYSKYPFLIDLVIFFLKTKSDEKLVKVLSGEYNRNKK